MTHLDLFDLCCLEYVRTWPGLYDSRSLAKEIGIPWIAVMEVSRLQRAGLIYLDQNDSGDWAWWPTSEGRSLNVTPLEVHRD